MESINLFGTDGIRQKVGNGLFTHENLHTIGKAIGVWSTSKYSSPKILLVHDTRISNDFIRSTINSGSLLYSVNIYNAGVLPTAAALILINQLNFDLAIIISASHNKWHDNGIKIFDKSGKISLKDEEIISNLILNEQKKDYSLLGCEKFFPEASELYIEQILKHFPKSFLKNKKIVLDLANGSTYLTAPKIFEKFGAEIITINNNPDGFNINLDCGSVYPETLAQKVIKQEAFAGFAFDGDGDRVIAVNKSGQVKNGDDILAILSKHPKYENKQTIVGTAMTNYGLEKFLTNSGKSLIRAQIGDRHVAEKLTEENLLLGGEPVGHIILRDLLPTGDGILVALHVLETIISNNNISMESFTKMPQVLINIPINKSKESCENSITEIVTAIKEQIKDSRILVRFSGTEPLLRIMVESETHEQANNIAHLLSTQIQSELDKI